MRGPHGAAPVSLSMADHRNRPHLVRRPAALVAVLTTVLLVGLGACGGDGEGDATGDGATTTTATASGGGDDYGGGDSGGTSDETFIEAKDFSLTSITVAPGSSVKVENAGSATHTVTADDGAFDSGRVAGGAAGSFTAPTDPGKYPFHCELHASMTGTLTVEG